MQYPRPENSSPRARKCSSHLIPLIHCISRHSPLAATLHWHREPHPTTTPPPSPYVASQRHHHAPPSQVGTAENMTAFATPVFGPRALAGASVVQWAQFKSCRTDGDRRAVVPSCMVAHRAAAARVFTAAAATVAVACSAFAPVFAEPISAEQCVSGEGPGCTAAAEESPLIRELLEKSRANKAKNDRATLEEYWRRGYGSYFSFGYNKDLVQDDDGKWSLQDPDDLRSRIERKIGEQIRAKLKKE